MKENVKNNNCPKVTVFLPAYNHEAYVGAAIESVLQQSFTDYELLIGDDASPDNTVEAIKKYADPRITLYAHTKNYGATFNHLFLLERARGEYVALINSDDIWYQGKLEKQVRYLDEHPEAVMCTSWARFIDETGTEIDPGVNVFVQENRSQAQWIRHFFTKGNCICHPGVLIRRSVYEKLNYYNLALRQLPDFEMWTRMIREGEFYVFPEYLVGHRRFTDMNKNTSGATVSNSVRDVIESYYILTGYLEDLPDELFKAAFREDLRNPDIQTPEEVVCEKFFLLLSGKYYMPEIYKQAAITYLLRHYTKDVARVLRENYGYELRDFHALSCQVDLLGLRAPTPTPQPEPAPVSAEPSPERVQQYIRENRLKTVVWALLNPNSRFYDFCKRVYKRINGRV